MNNDNADGLIFKKVNPFSDMKFVEELWTDLQKRSVHSYFNSWGWISTWLTNLPSDSKIQLHIGYIEGRPVLAFFLGESCKKRYRFLSTHLLSLNATANPYYDVLHVEYNTILYHTSLHLPVDAILDYIGKLNWDEFILHAVSQQFVTDFKLLKSEEIKRYKILHFYSENSYFVNLQDIRDNNMNFLNLLSANRRSQIRRSLKQYEKDGKIQVNEASSVSEALKMLDGLALLHQQEWIKRGKPGAFSNPFFYQFHKDLINNRFAKGEVQLLHLFTNTKEIGYLYFLVYRNEVLFYQSGLNYQADNNYRPGLVSHYLAILHNSQKNMKTYDFLAGNSPYKRTFASDLNPMYWARMYKKGWRYLLAKTLLKKNQHLVNKTSSNGRE